MNKHILALCAWIMGILLLTSCLGSSDSDNDITYYNDTAITAFSLTTVNRYVHTTSNTGNDSVYKKTLSTPVKFNIDQYNRHIYNSDSLDADCDLTHVLVSITSKNGGVIRIKSMNSDTLWVYSSTDSLDFSQPREVRIFALDGSTYRDYKISINKHQTETGKLVWERVGDKDFYIDPATEEWEKRVKDNDLGSFIGAGTKEAYAFSTDGELMVSKDEGLTWTPDSIDDNSSLLPTTIHTFTTWKFEATSSTDCQLLVGISEAQENACVVWRKLAEYGASSNPSKWTYIPVESYNRYYLPRTDHVSIVYYKGYILAFCNDGNVYQSRDQGITWKTNSNMTYPAESNSARVDATTDKSGHIFIRDKENGEVWRGYIVD